jgi:Fur family ferric uptake transcriptional regulator
MTGYLIQKKLAKESYRLTRQRQAVLEVMQENQGRHLNVEEVLAKAREKEPALGIATVYRTLDKLSSLGILYKAAFDEGKYRYELATDEEHHHHHIVCVTCSKITEVEEDLLCDLESHIEEQGFKVLDHQLIIYAHCPECLAKQKNSQ